jgi:hypothetical protein
VADARTEFRRLLLRGLFWDAQDQGVRLEAALKSAVRGVYTQNGSGQAIIRAQGNGALIEFALPQMASSFTPEAISIAVEGLYSLLDSANTELSTDGNSAPTDAQVFARMLSLLQPSRAHSRGVDFSHLVTA